MTFQEMQDRIMKIAETYTHRYGIRDWNARLGGYDYLPEDGIKRKGSVVERL